MQLRDKPLLSFVIGVLLYIGAYLYVLGLGITYIWFLINVFNIKAFFISLIGNGTNLLNLFIASIFGFLYVVGFIAFFIFLIISAGFIVEKARELIYGY